MPYIISVGFIFIGSIVVLFLSGGSVGGTVDFPSFFVMISTIFMSLCAAGSVRDFFRALKIAVSKKDFSALQIAQSEVAVSLVMQSLLCAMGFIVFLCIPMLLSLLNDVSNYGPVIALALLTMCYTCEILIILVPVKSILQKKRLGFKKNPTENQIFKFSKIPCTPCISFLLGIIALFFLISLGHTFVLSDFPPRLLSFVFPMLLCLILLSYLILFASGLLIPFFRALLLGISTKCNALPQQLSESHRALNAAILIRFAISGAGAVFLAVGTLNSIDESTDVAFGFSVPLILISLSFFSALFLLPFRARIEKALNFKMYAGEK